MGAFQFLTVYDLGLSPEETQLWGGLPHTPEEYPRIDGLSAQDSALLHIVMVCLQRGDYVRAKRYAEHISDPHAKEARLALIHTESENPTMAVNGPWGPRNPPLPRHSKSTLL